MPTITCSRKDLNNLLGKRLTDAQLEHALSYAKAELEKIDRDELTIAFNDTNQPFLWSVEGLTRWLKGVLNLEKGIPELVIAKETPRVITVDDNVRKIRPFLSAFIVKGKKIDEYLLKQLIQLQEKFCSSYGVRRKKVSIGLYPADKISFPVVYKGVLPESVSFVPLEYPTELNLREILEEHPTGREYGHLVKNEKLFPIVVDKKNKVLSFPPIINSADLGKLRVGDDHVLFEATGLNEDAVILSSIIFAYAFSDRGFTIHPVRVEYGEKKIVNPVVITDVMEITEKQVKQLLGLDLSRIKIQQLLKKARYNVAGLKVTVPAFRKDVMHPFDVIEDIGIMYGYDNIKELPLTTYTVGGALPIVGFVDVVREIIIGLGFLEVFSHVLANPQNMFKQMNIDDFGSVAIENFSSATFSSVRSWLLPVLLETLSKNRHVDYPQRLFEQGLVTVRKGNKIIDYERVALVTAHKDANYTEVKQIVDVVMRMVGVEFETVATEHDSFIPGRVSRVIVQGKKVGYVGEIHPKVLTNWELIVPVAGFEINLTELFEVIS